MGMSEYFYMQKGTDVYEWINYPFKKIIRSMKYHQWLEHWTCVQSRANAKKTLSKHLTIYVLIPISQLHLHPEETFWIFKHALGANLHLQSSWSQHITIEVYYSLRVAWPYRRLTEANKGTMFKVSFSLCISWMAYNTNTCEPNV